MNIIKKTVLAVLVLSMAFAMPFGTACSDGGQSGNNGDNNDGPVYVPDDTDGPGDSTDNPTDGPGDNTDDPTDGPGDNTDDPTDGPGEIKPDPDPPATADAVKITEGAGDLETAYVKWEALSGASWYNVYYKSESGDNWTKLDAPLVRQYKSYFRADAIGLKAGKYSLKVVPVGSTGSEIEDKSAIKNVAVDAHERVGYAFVGENGQRVIPGTYNEDGTLKDGVRVVYITDENKNNVKFDVITGVNGKVATSTGIQEIFTNYKKGYDTRPVCVRFIGNINIPSNTVGGDLECGNFPSSGDYLGGAVTLEGVGDDATINGFGITLKRASMFEIRNLGFMNCSSKEGDNVSVATSNDHVWVHNCDMFYGNAGSDADQVKGDGALDTKRSSYVTHSYNHFWDSGKCNLQGMKEDVEKDALITYHHNWYDHSDSRHPRVRSATVHVFNNYFDGNSEYGVGATYGCSIFVENNYFRTTATMRPMLIAGQATDFKDEPKKGHFSGENGGMIKAYGNTFEGNKLMITQNDTTDKSGIDCYLASSRDEIVPADYVTKKGGNSYNNFDTAADMYEYTPDTPEIARDKVMKYAGRVGGGDLKFTFNNATEDGNKNIIPALKALLTNYSSDIVAIGKDD